MSHRWNHTLCSLCVWFPSLSIVFPRLIHVAIGVSPVALAEVSNQASSSLPTPALTPLLTTMKTQNHPSCPLLLHSTPNQSPSPREFFAVYYVINPFYALFLGAHVPPSPKAVVKALAVGGPASKNSTWLLGRFTFPGAVRLRTLASCAQRPPSAPCHAGLSGHGS